MFAMLSSSFTGRAVHSLTFAIQFSFEYHNIPLCTVGRPSSVLCHCWQRGWTMRTFAAWKWRAVFPEDPPGWQLRCGRIRLLCVPCKRFGAVLKYLVSSFGIRLSFSVKSTFHSHTAWWMMGTMRELYILFLVVKRFCCPIFCFVWPPLLSKNWSWGECGVRVGGRNVTSWLPLKSTCSPNVPSKVKR